MKRASTAVIGLLAAIVATTCLIPDSAEARTRQRQVQKWHGWTGAGSTFHLDGVAYPGGSRRGPATAYNNWEGGFHPVAFWVLHQRSF